MNGNTIPKDGDWTEVKRFRSGVTCVIVTKQDGPPPRYSMQIGRLGDGEGQVLLRYFGVYTVLDSGELELQSSLIEPITKLICKAEEYILSEARKYRTESLAEKRA